MKKIFEICFYIGVLIVSFQAGVYLSKPTVSVIMPTYNREELLPRAIESILAQTYKDFEFIIVDDGSTDNTMHLLKQYADKDKRIRVFRNAQNKGIAYSRERGLNSARGKYIAIMDSDDVSTPTRLEKQVAFLEKSPDVAVVIGLTKNVATNNVWWRTTDPQEIIFTMHFDNTIGNPQTMIRRSFLTRNNIHYKMNYAASEDYDFFKQIIFAGGKIIRTNDVVLAVRYHNENPYAYYVQQSANRARVSKEFLSRYGIDWSGATDPTCDVVSRMAANNVAGLLNDDFLKQKQIELCEETR